LTLRSHPLHLGSGEIKAVEDSDKVGSTLAVIETGKPPRRNQLVLKELKGSVKPLRKQDEKKEEKLHRR
jgi:hypothetical protein